MTDYGAQRHRKMKGIAGKRRSKYLTLSTLSLASGWMPQHLRLMRYALTISLKWMTR